MNSYCRAVLGPELGELGENYDAGGGGVSDWDAPPRAPSKPKAPPRQSPGRPPPSPPTTMDENPLIPIALGALALTVTGGVALWLLTNPRSPS